MQVKRKHLSKIANKAKLDFAKALKAGGNIASGDLIKHFNFGYGKANTIEFTFYKYARAVDKGSKAVRSNRNLPFDPIKKWAKLKGLSEKDAWRVWSGIKAHGTKAHPFLDKWELMAMDIDDDVITDIVVDMMNNTFKKYFK